MTRSAATEKFIPVYELVLEGAEARARAGRHARGGWFGRNLPRRREAAPGADGRLIGGDRSEAALRQGARRRKNSYLFTNSCSKGLKLALDRAATPLENGLDEASRGAGEPPEGRAAASPVGRREAAPRPGARRQKPRVRFPPALRRADLPVGTGFETAHGGTPAEHSRQAALFGRASLCAWTSRPVTRPHARPRSNRPRLVLERAVARARTGRGSCSNGPERQKARARSGRDSCSSGPSALWPIVV